LLFLTQLVPGLSSIGFYTTLLPLAVVLGVTMVKDLYDDIVSANFNSLVCGIVN